MNTTPEPAERPQSDIFDVISSGLEARTLRYSSNLGLSNAELNKPFILQTIKALTGKATGKTSLIVSGGPSIGRRNSLQRIKPVIDKFVVVAADGGMSHCLRAGITPDYVLTVDPDRNRVVRWYGDDNLTEEKLADDYFRRQDLDDHFTKDEVIRNEEQIRIVNEAGPSMTAVLATSACEDVRRRATDSGMSIYWWNPIYDDVSDPDSLTRTLYNSNKVPCMNTGGNVGTAATIFASRVLSAKRVVMIGMDFSYYADLPIERTQYYDQFLEFMTDAEISHAFKTIRNPHLNEDYYTDPAYNWYREAFLDLLGSMKGCEVINATEAGILFGEGIIWKSLDEVIELMKSEDS